MNKRSPDLFSRTRKKKKKKDQFACVDTSITVAEFAEAQTKFR